MAKPYDPLSPHQITAHRLLWLKETTAPEYSLKGGLDPTFLDLAGCDMFKDVAALVPEKWHRSLFYIGAPGALNLWYGLTKD